MNIQDSGSTNSFFSETSQIPKKKNPKMKGREILKQSRHSHISMDNLKLEAVYHSLHLSKKVDENPSEYKNKCKPVATLLNLTLGKDKLETLFRLICMLGNRSTIIFCNRLAKSHFN